MTSHTIELDQADYEALERSARLAGLSVRAFLKSLLAKASSQEVELPRDAPPSRWALLSQKVRRDPPLRGAGEYVRQSSQAFREDFALTRDDLRRP